MPMSVIFRVDASILSGSGHVVRCLTLAEELRRAGARVAFISRRHPGHLNELVRRRGFRVEELPEAHPPGTAGRTDAAVRSEYAQWLGVSREQDAAETVAALQGERPDWLVVDHYGIDRRWEETLRAHVRKIMVIDDLADRPHDCDVLLDQNFIRDGKDRYDNLVPPSCSRLLGPRYALLRPEFVKARKHLKPRTGDVRRVLVYFGGTDLSDVTGRTLDALSHPELVDLEVEVVLGVNNPHQALIERRIDARPGTRLHIQVADMARLMTRVDLSVGAGGGTTWERLCLGLPSLVVTVAENQEHFTAALHDEGYLNWLGPACRVGSRDILEALVEARGRQERNRAQSNRGKELVSGDGAQSVSSFLTRGIGPEHWNFRRANAADCELYWQWANDLDARNNSFNPETIEWEGHQSWFHSRLNVPDALLLLAESHVGAVGQVRFEIKPGDRRHGYYTIGFSIARQFRGLGLGRILLARGIEVFRESNDSGVIGEVKEHNHSSARIFENLGFDEMSPEVPGSRRFVLLREDPKATGSTVKSTLGDSSSDTDVVGE